VNQRRISADKIDADGGRGFVNRATEVDRISLRAFR